MTIKELCRKYDCDKTSIYRKIKRKGMELEGHILNENGVIIIDEYAEEMLKPGEYQRKTREWIKKGRTYDQSIRKAEIETNIERSERDRIEDENDSLRLRIEKDDNRIQELEETVNEQNKEIEILRMTVSELRQEIDRLERKPKSLFGRGQKY